MNKIVDGRIIWQRFVVLGPSYLAAIRSIDSSCRVSKLLGWQQLPTAVIPFTADQTFWGEKVYRMGIGPRPIPHRKLTVENLSQAIGEVVSNSAMRQRASQVGDALRSENGAGNAARIIDQYLTNSTSESPLRH